MADVYRIFGAELSPYSVKVRSYFRYKRIPHAWIERNATNIEEFRRHARLPLIPLVIRPDGSALQDSTPIIETLEAEYAEPAIHPADPALAFVSALLEEYADEWGNKWMFHFRWTYEPDQKSAAERLARANAVGQSEEAIASLAQSVIARMVPRLSFVGSSEKTAPCIEASYARCLERVEAHLETRRYLFGERPAFADFGLFAQLHQCWTDPTAGARLEKGAPRVKAWIERMLQPVARGDFEGWDALGPTLEPLLRDEVGARFLPWSTANAAALAASEPRFAVELAGERFEQDTQKYHARSLRALRERYAAVADRSELDPILERTDCLRWLR
ncbi:MAG: glutathione S-transferase [Deltaproteobacteria bacterium]|nr:MAG: glutathione S-transferase [Deltaproteobacteria bacterium]